MSSLAVVLVVDDEAVTRRVVVHALKAVEVEAVAAADAAEALRLAGEREFRLAIVDINLPDIDGFTLIGKLRALPHMQDIPYIVFTARNHAEDAMLVVESGAVGFLYKPFSTQEIRAMVKHHLNLP